MSHLSMAALWKELEGRRDVATILREAIGQYTMEIVSNDEDGFAPTSLQAIDRLVNLIYVAFQLQRTYLQSKAPSSKALQYLMEPREVFDVLSFLLHLLTSSKETVNQSCVAAEHSFRLLGTSILSGLRLLTHFKAKTISTRDVAWTARTKTLRCKFEGWPLPEDSLHRFLTHELCLGVIEQLSKSTEDQAVRNFNNGCRYHEQNRPEGSPRLRGFVDLPDYFDGLYPLRSELHQVISEVTACIRGQCPWWFDSFCAWYDIWSAVIAASVQMYIRGSKNLNTEKKNMFFELYDGVAANSLTTDDRNNDSRWLIFRKALLGLNPFPRCSMRGCDCFGRLLSHEYQEDAWALGGDRQASMELKHIQSQISGDLGFRQHLLQDADGHVSQMSNQLQQSVRDWTDFPSTHILEVGQSDVYIVNCPKLHSLTSMTLKRILEDADESRSIEDLKKSAEIVIVDGVKIPCPRENCNGFFTLARLVEPLRMMRQELHVASRPYARSHGTLKIATLQPNTPQRNSLTSELSPTTPARSGSVLSQESHDSAANNALTTSGGQSSRTSSRRRFIPSRSSGSASPPLHVSYAVVSDANFVLAYSSHRISCYDCELGSWSKGHSFAQIVLAAGSSAGYAVISMISKEPARYRLSAIRRDTGAEQEIWSSDLAQQPYSLAFSRSGLKIAVGLALGVQLFDVATGTSKTLPTPVPEKHWQQLQVDSQCLSFSIDGSRLVEATREAKDGLVFTAMHHLSPSDPQSLCMKVFNIPVRYSNDFRLSSIVVDEHTGTIMVCSSTSKGQTYTINSLTGVAKAITQADFAVFPGDQIQCATVVPGPYPRMALVNDRNELSLLQYLDNRWRSDKHRRKLDGSRLEVKKIDEKLSMAANKAGMLTMFWMQGKEGRLLRFDPMESGWPKPETISTPF